MLNELHDLAESLKRAKVSIVSWHSNFKTCPKGSATYYTLLDESGGISDLERIRDRERLATIRKWEVAAGVSFPAFNVLPLFEPSTAELKRAASDLRKALLSKSPPETEEVRQRVTSLAKASNSLWVGKELDRITKCLGFAGEVGRLVDAPPDEFCSIAELLTRSTKLTAERLHEELATILGSKLTAAPATAAEWFDALFFHNGKTPKKWSLIAELADRSAFPYPANHERVQTWMNSCFQAAAQAVSGKSAANDDVQTDAFANPADGFVGSFPSVRLPVLGNVILRSMSSESPCQRRYGFAEAKSFPAGAVSRQEMKNAIEWIGDTDRREKTWCDVSSLIGAGGVLFAYPSQKTEVAPELAGFIAGFDEEADPDGARFEACASRVTASLTELAHEAPATEVRIFVLKKADKARTKVLHSACYSVNRLLSSAEEWKTCCRNLPTVKIRQFAATKGDKPFWKEPFVPYPAEVVTCLNTAWERAGTRAAQVLSFGIGDGLGLLLEKELVLHTIATRAIRSLVVNSLSLVLALGQAHHQGLVHPLGKKHGKHALLLPSIFGLLLAKLGRWKGDYMKGPPFLVGRLLALADQLHVQYCHGVRKGHVPPQLVGNALMATALEQPRKAIDLLAQRILPYQAWARTLQGGEEVRLTKYVLGELGRVSSELKDYDLPATSGDGEKAEMLLGYLARSEKGHSSEDTTTNSGGTPT